MTRVDPPRDPPFDLSGGAWSADGSVPRPVDAGDGWVARLPHRPPFRFVDVVDRCEPGRSVSARWQIAGDEPWLAGHFPGNPIVPGVLQLEALAQAGAIAVLADPAQAGRLPLFGGVEEVRFRGQVGPGDEVRLDVDIERLGGRGGWGRGRATVDGVETCTGRLLFVLVDQLARTGQSGASSGTKATDGEVAARSRAE